MENCKKCTCKKIEDGGPVQAQHFRYVGKEEQYFDAYAEGLRIRDYFATRAMQSLMDRALQSHCIGTNGLEHTIAADAYRVADAMIQARATA